MSFYCNRNQYRHPCVASAQEEHCRCICRCEACVYGRVPASSCREARTQSACGCGVALFDPSLIASALKNLFCPETGCNAERTCGCRRCPYCGGTL